MEAIEKALQENNVAFTDLPENLQERVHTLAEMVKTYNDAIGVFNENDYQDDEEAKNLDNREAEIIGIQTGLIDDVNDAISKIKSAEQQAEAEAQKQAELEQQAAANATETKKKEEGGFLSVLGWVFVIAAAAVGINAATKK